MFLGRTPPYLPVARELWEHLCHRVPTNSWQGVECCRPNKFRRPPLRSRKLQTTENQNLTSAERLVREECRTCWAGVAARDLGSSVGVATNTSTEMSYRKSGGSAEYLTEVGGEKHS